jgi:predicted NodU family carbamoyl transferase
LACSLLSWTEKALTRSHCLDHVYPGPESDETGNHIDAYRFGQADSFHRNIEQEIARRLAEGFVVARFNGRIEFGPRTPGSRSIPHQLTDRSVNDWLAGRGCPQITGSPTIINTSFNTDAKPFVCNPNDALSAFHMGHLDLQAIWNYLVRNPEPILREEIR